MLNNLEQEVRQELDSIIDNSDRNEFDAIVDFILNAKDFNVKQLRKNVVWYYKLYNVSKTRQISHLKNPFK